jgi:hypothetical protein
VLNLIHLWPASIRDGQARFVAAQVPFVLAQAQLVVAKLKPINSV